MVLLTNSDALINVCIKVKFCYTNCGGSLAGQKVYVHRFFFALENFRTSFEKCKKEKNLQLIYIYDSYLV